MYTDEDSPLTLRAYLEDYLKSAQLETVIPESFNYLAPIPLYRSEKPYLSRLPFCEGLKRTNIVGQSYSVEIFNVAGREEHFLLETSGFQFLRFPIPATSWTQDYVRSDYIPLLSRWLKGHFNCDEVLIYAYNVRESAPPHNSASTN